MKGYPPVTMVGIGILFGSSAISLVLLVFARDDLLAAKAENDSLKAAYEDNVADVDAATKAAEHLIMNNGVLQDYVGRGEPEIRLCVPSHNDPPKVRRVEHCALGEREVVFPITYSEPDHHPDLGKPTVDYRSLNSP